jgi:hypothetical protein
MYFGPSRLSVEQFRPNRSYERSRLSTHFPRHQANCRQKSLAAELPFDGTKFAFFRRPSRADPCDPATDGCWSEGFRIRVTFGVSGGGFHETTPFRIRFTKVRQW